MIVQRLTKIFTLSWQAFGRYRLKIVLLTVLGFIEVLLEGVGINALIPLFSFAFGTENKAGDFISRLITRFFHSLHLDLSVTSLLIFIGLLFVGKAIIGIWINLLRAKTTNEYAEQLKNNLFGKILYAGWPYLMRQKSGYLETILLQDVPVSSSMLNQFATLLSLIVGLAVYSLVAINISLPITLTAFGLGGILLLIFRPVYSKVRKIAELATALSKEAVHHVSEHIIGTKTVKVMRVEAGAVEKGRQYFRKLKELAIKNEFLKSLSGALIIPTGVIFILIIFALFYKSQNFNLAALAVIAYLIDRIFNYIQQLQRSLHTANDSLAHVMSVLNYEKLAAEYREADAGTKAFEFQKNLEFRAVSFAYERGKEVLQGLNFFIKKGKIVGIVGPSGVGKTTVVDLILRLLVPTSGQILLDGVDISEVSLAAWRDRIGYVSQDIFLLNDTIENNIRFYNHTLTEAEVEEGARMANIYDFIENCPQRFDTMVGERGIALSVGQRQRIVIARVLARNPQLLILDEATSALDNESEARIQEVIQNLRGKITVLIIAHRLSTVINCDRVIALMDGRVVEEGVPQQLLEDRTSYFHRVYHLNSAEAL